MGSVKGTITRRAESVLDGLESEFRELCTREDFERKIEALEKAGSKSDRPSKLRNLCDMFDMCGIEYERGRDNDYYKNLVETSEFPTFSEVADRMLLALFARYEEYPSPEDYMKRIVDRLCNEEDGWKNDTLRLRILKQFIKYGDYLYAAGYGGKNAIREYVEEKIGRRPSEEEILLHLEDEIFDRLKTAKKPQKKPEGKFGLLKTADDLASGKFRTQGATKRSLYLFAMVYGMTYYSGSSEDAEIIHYKTDIETNLFRDYYSNNLMRYISEAYKGNLDEYELDPSGQGINYKNFAEMIYLYYISKDCNPQEKIRLSSEMIERVQEKQFRKGRVNVKEKDRTKFYRNLFGEEKLRLSESEFENYICEEYDCDTYDGSYTRNNRTVDNKKSPFQMETAQKSAFREYQTILKGLEKLGIALENCNYGLWFTDVAAFRKSGIENICDRRNDIDRRKFEEFMELLIAINDFIGQTVTESEGDQNMKQERIDPSRKKTKALYVPSPEKVTRTSLMVAYYYYFNALHEDDGNYKWKSFKEVYNSFQDDIDPRLDAANYQRLSGKNIFDVLLTFSSYAYLNF